MAQFIGKELSAKRVCVAISCDLSHYHSTDPTSPYARDFNSDAQPFDDLIVEWAKTDIDSTHLARSNDVLISKAGPLTDHIGSCGYTRLTVLQAILSSGVKESDTSFKANLLSYCVPTYYGMIVSHFLSE